jgi:beta-phosphoglucomutase-like phosphatase (HAD superfamily)
MNNYDLSNVVNQYDGLCLDNDGTCARTEELHAEVGALILREEGGVNITYEERLSYMGMGEHGIWDHLHAHGRTPSISKDEFKRLQSVRFLEALKSMRDASALERPGIKRLAQAFRDANKPVIVVSNTPRDVVTAIQRLIALDALVHHVITFDDMMSAGLRAKPEPDGYIWAKQIAESIAPKKTGRILAVEDAHKGWLSAHRADCDTIHIFYQSIGQTANPEATFTVADHLDVCDAFLSAASGHKKAGLDQSIPSFTPPIEPLIKRDPS